MIRHIVAEGQSPAEVAERYGVSLTELVKLNGFEPGQAIPAGIMLWVPEAPAWESETGRSPALPLLRVPGALFDALRRQQDDFGTVALRIVRIKEGEELLLEIP